MKTYDRLADLPLRIDSYHLHPLEREVSSEFARTTTVIRLKGGVDGEGEDVTYDAEDHVVFRQKRRDLPLAGTYTLSGFSRHLDGLDLFPVRPKLESARYYRRWAFESAALDLALRQAGESLAARLELPCRPVRFVVSMRLGEPPAIGPMARLLEYDPRLRFKLDPTSSWDEALIAEVAATGAVESLDFKGAYRGTVVDQPADPVLYRRVAEAFPGAWLEDPHLVPETETILGPHRDRITWDAPIHSVSDMEALPFPPRMVNIKPSRFGSLEALLDAYDYCRTREIRAYGGGQFELGPGRGQIQYLASLFHPDTPNDVAPRGYNDPEPGPGLPGSPLEPAPSPSGFRWESP